jgi:hypothetical protein
MKPWLSILTALFFSMFLFVSCYKIETEANSLPQGYSVSQIIGTWKIIGVTSDKAYDWDGNGSTEKDIYNTWNDCKKDNLYQFNSNYSGLYRLECGTSQEGTWYLGGTTILAWSTIGSSLEYEKIVYMTTDTMKTESQLLNPDGQTYNIIKVWKLQ